MKQGWEEIYMAAHQCKADIAKDLLASAGIKNAVIKPRDTAYQNFGEIKIYIAKENIAEAKNLIKDLKGE